MEKLLALFSGVQLSPVLEQYGGWLVFLGTLFTGEVTILPSFILAAQGYLPLSTVFIYSVLATICADLFWYTAGRLFPRYFSHLKIFQKSSAILMLDRQFSNHSIAWILLIAKFLYGFRWVTIMYLTLRGVKFFTFAFLDLIGIVFFIAILATLGILAGQGIYNPIPAYERATAIVSTIIFSALILLALRAAVGYVRRTWVATK